MATKILKIKKQLAKELKTYKMDRYNSRMFLLGANSKGIISHMIYIPRNGGCNERQAVNSKTLTATVMRLYQKNLNPVGIFMIPSREVREYYYSNESIIQHVKDNLYFLRYENKGSVIMAVLDNEIYAAYSADYRWKSFKIKEV